MCVWCVRVRGEGRERGFRGSTTKHGHLEMSLFSWFGPSLVGKIMKHWKCKKARKTTNSSTKNASFLDHGYIGM